MTHFTHYLQSLFLLCIFVLIPSYNAELAGGRIINMGPQLTDSLYNAHHPRLLFTEDDIPALYDKVRDGGNDDEAYSLVRFAAEFIYPDSTMEELLNNDYALEAISNLGLAGFLETPKDTAALAIGRNLTIYIADSFDVDYDDFESSLRLRSLVLGYDMFFENSSESERNNVRDEIISYIDMMTTSGSYEIWLYRPYLGNRSVMVAASLGMAAICLDGETDPAKISAALDFADAIIDAWLSHQLDEYGAYNEGVTYGCWSMRMLIYYFHAREKFDGYNYSSINRIQNMEKWLAYELLPEGSGRTNNLNDCAYNDYILSRHHTYFDWAQAEWGSNLSSWIWEHTAGDYGRDWELQSDKAATVIWNQTLPPEQPETVLPKSFLWGHRGLYYYRSGWDMGPASSDVAFSFYAGVFQGAHAQEDQGQFTLYGYGTKFAIDHGTGTRAKQSKSHNIILIDDIGQHNVGGSIGTDGVIREYLLSDYADFLVGDLTDAYTTYSKWNNPNVPFPGSDWSWGYDGGNPVNYAHRTVIAVHDSILPPYFMILDDIEKDGSSHQYSWRMHTHDSNTVDTSANPIQISKGASRLDVHIIEPPFESLQKSVTPFDNLNEDPDALVLSLSVADTSPHFSLLLLPTDGLVPVPSVSKEVYAWGYTLTMDWGGGVTDIFALNTTGGAVTYSVGAPAPAGTNRAAGSQNKVIPAAAEDSITTDASLALVRLEGMQLIKHLLAKTSFFTYNGTNYVSVANGPLSCGFSGGVIQVDRYDADFTFYAPGISEVYYRTQKIHVISQDGYLTPDPAVGVAEESPPVFFFHAKAYPNPFNPSTTVLIELPKRAGVEATVYDIGGRRIKKLWRGVLPCGTNRIEWNGTNEKGIRVASGVYFLKIQSRGYSRILKLVVVK